MPAPVKRPTGPSISDRIREAGQKAKANVIAGEQEALLGTVDVSGIVRPRAPRIFSVLDYIEQSWGLGMTLFPVQKFIVKLYYHLPLDDRNKTITITDMFNTKVLHRFTEKEYLRFLYNEGRCNIGDQDHARRELCLAIGRRGGKTTLSGIFASYEIYRLLNLHNPQGYYGLPPGNRIQIISVATDKDQASLLFNEVTSHLSRCEYFKPYIANNTQSHIQFRTPSDIEAYGPTNRTGEGRFVSFNGKATIRVTFKSCVAKGLRGAGNAVVILDEMAHFQNKGQASAKDIYDAVTPSTAAFSPKDPANPAQPIGDVEARVICISSPLNREGKFFEIFQAAMSKSPGSENVIAIQAPTWEVNPTVDPGYYRQKYHADPSVFMTEHGAQFSDRVKGWIEREEDLVACIDNTRAPVQVGTPRYPHQMGIDVGLVGDGTAIAITHAEADGVVALDYHEVWYAGIPWAEANPHLDPSWASKYAKSLQNVERLDFDEIAVWIAGLTKRFHITDGIFDRWSGIPLEQSLHKIGLKQFRSDQFSRDLSSRMYQNFKLLMFDGRLSLYEWPRPKDGLKHSPLVGELLTLQAQMLSKNMVIVEAPKMQGAHDDVSDALMRAVWLTTERLGNQKIVGGAGTGNRPVAPPPMTVGRYQMNRMRSHGVVRDRLNVRSLGVRLRTR